MPTLEALKGEADRLGLTGYVRMKKPQLESLIQAEILRRENAALEAIRQAPAPETEKIRLDNLRMTEPLEFDSTEIPDELIQPVKGKGIDNATRLSNYVRQADKRSRLTPARLRRLRKHYNAGDLSVSFAALFPTVNVLPYI